jgi:hypothetical protein
MADKEQIESQNVDVIVDYLISFRSANEVGDRRGALLVAPADVAPSASRTKLRRVSTSVRTDIL